VEPVPGPSAIVSALSASGLPTDSFAFLGFLPAKTTQRRKALEEARDLGMTAVFYETPHRILEALADIAAVFGDTAIALGRELTKLHEEFLTGTAVRIAAQLAARPAIKGEFTLVIAPAAGAPVSELPIEEEVAGLVGAGTPRMDALKLVARRRGLSKREVYRLMQGG